MKSLTCGMPVGPDEERGIKFAINCIDISLKMSSSEVLTTWHLMLDPLIDSETNKKKFTDLFGERVKFFSVSSKSKNAIKRAESKCGDIHGTLLDDLVHTADSKYFCIHDSDIVFLRKNWNKYIVDLFESDENLIAIGPESPLSDGWRNIPTSMIVAFRTEEFKKLGVTLNKTYSSLTKFPNAGIVNEDRTVTVDKNNQKYWNRELGTKVYLETGYELVPALVESGKRWITLKTLVGDNKSQWYYDEEGKIFATHMTGSYFRPWGSEIRKSWSQRIEKEISENMSI